MGAVFLAEDESTHARVALKRMLAPDLDRGRFLREAALLERMNHPSFVRYVAHGEDDEGAWLAMEWLEGSDLSDVLQRDLPAFGVGLELSAQILEALVVAHESQVIHRDIKPANVFVLAGPAPRVKLLDLGIARPLDASMVLTATGAIIGTPLYMAPEVLRGQPASVASDTYAAATVVFEILSGRPPFVAETSFAVIGRILLDEAPSLSQFAPDAPQSVVDALKQALHKDPAGRPPANALAESLRAAVSAWAAGDTVGMGASLAIGANLLRENRSAAVLVVRGAARVGDVWQHLVSEGSGCDVLPDGTLLALLTIPGAPDASLFRAVRLALDVYARDPGAAIVASTSRSEGLTTSVGGKAFARAGEVRATGPGVHLDRESAQMLGDRYALHDHGEYVTVRAEEPVEEERRLLGRVTPTVGREAEIAQLLSVVRAVAEEGAPRIAIVVGPAGHGKSRLRKHVLTELARPPQSVASIVARFEPGSEGTSCGRYRCRRRPRRSASTARVLRCVARVGRGAHVVPRESCRRCCRGRPCAARPRARFDASAARRGA